MKYDKIIIGFGKGGKTLAGFLGKNKEKVALIEESNMMYGGTCINIGCIPSKKLINNARLNNYINAISEKNKLIETLRGKNYSKVANFADVYDGKASFIDKNTVLVKTLEGDKVLEADTIIINTGAKSIIPNIEGLKESKRMYTSTSLMYKEELPKNLVIIGAGNIGLEFSNMYKNFGSNVTLIEMGNRILPREDEDVALEVQKELEAAGINFIFNSGVVKVEDKDDDTTDVILKDGSVINSDAILVVIGRKPYTEGLNLEKIGVETRPNGSIVVDDTLKTSVDNIYAIGDVRGGLQFTYISMDDFRIIKNNLYGDKTRKLSDRVNVPYTLFTDPSLARVGITEKEAKEKGYNYKVFKLDVKNVPQGYVLNDSRGFLKAVVDLDNNMILGAAILSKNSYEIINVISIAIENNLPYTYLRDKIFTHPTMTELLNDLFSN